MTLLKRLRRLPARRRQSGEARSAAAAWLGMLARGDNAPVSVGPA